MPYENRDPKRDHNFDNHPCESAEPLPNKAPVRSPSLRETMIGFRSLGFRGLGFRVVGFRVRGLGVSGSGLGV